MILRSTTANPIFNSKENKSGNLVCIPYNKISNKRVSVLSDRTGILLLLVFVLFLITLSNRSFSQSATVCTTSVSISNFGVDGDLYANSPANASGDDWFYSTQFPGSNIGIIGVSAATATPPISAATFKSLIQAGTDPISRNRTYQQRMSVPNGAVINNQLLFDAVAARDNISSAGAFDSSMFYGFGNKNGYNPTLWSIGTNNVPQKNDLVDVGGHIRQDLTSGHLIGYGFATTRSTSGDSHTDFEFYRTIPVFDMKTRTVSNTGPAATGGHTATIFNSNGIVSQPGDILISIDYSNGGKNPAASVRVWINPSNIDSLGHDTTYINSKPSRPFTFTGVFNVGTGTNGYGYAEVKPNTVSSSSCLINAVVNSNASLGTAWGNLTGPLATYSDFMDPMQLVEISIDFTAFGFGINLTSANVCSVTFGSLLVKTRTSHSFTSELKDYVGPFAFQVQ